MQVLLDQGVTEFPVDVWALCEQYGIVTETYRSEKESPGCCFIYDGVPMIFMDDRMTEARQRFVCAHELGHILTGHVGAWTLADDKSGIPHKIKEREAMVFAAELLMPQVVLSAIGVTTITQIRQLCDVDHRPAFYSLKELERREKTAELSELEKHVCDYFRRYIERIRI